MDAVACITDPRCVREYTPPENGTDLSIGVPQEERGVIPIWALNVVDYVSAKNECDLTDLTPVGLLSQRSEQQPALVGRER